MTNKTSLIIGIGIFLVALGIFVWVTDAPAYMGHEAATCNNCHVMDAQYEGWYHAAHAGFAVCADCHIPHQNLVYYYTYKGYSGMKDVYSFVTKSYPPAIRATALTDKIIQSNCIRCHESTVDVIVSTPMPLDRDCWNCHRSVAHGARGLSLVPLQDTEVYAK